MANLAEQASATLGGVVIGLAEIMTQGYLDVAWLGSNVEVVVPYVLMVLVLLWRPEGLLGTRRVERV